MKFGFSTYTPAPWSAERSSLPQHQAYWKWEEYSLIFERYSFWFCSSPSKEVPLEKILEELDKQLTELQELHLTARERWRKWISSLVVYTIVFEFLYLGIFYFYFYVPAQANSEPIMDKSIHFSPFALIPLLGWILVKLTNLYYGRQIANHELKLEQLRLKQKTKLEQFVQERDFVHTQQLINKYTKNLNATAPPTPPSTPQPKPVKATAPPSATPKKPRSNPVFFTPPTTRTPATPSDIPTTPVIRNPVIRTPQVPPKPTEIPQTPTSNNNNNNGNNGINASTSTPQPNREMPRYTLPVPKDVLFNKYHAGPTVHQSTQNQAWFDKMIDYLLGPEYNAPPSPVRTSNILVPALQPPDNPEPSPDRSSPVEENAPQEGTKSTEEKKND